MHGSKRERFSLSTIDMSMFCVTSFWLINHIAHLVLIRKWSAVSSMNAKSAVDYSLSNHGQTNVVFAVCRYMCHDQGLPSITNGAFRLRRACLDLSSHPIWHLASNLINLFLTSRDVSGIDWFMADCQQVWSVDGYSRNVVVRVALSSEIRSSMWWLFLPHMTNPLFDTCTTYWLYKLCTIT